MSICDVAVTLVDAIFLLRKFAFGAVTPDCLGTPDANCDGSVDPADLVPVLQQVADLDVVPCLT